MPRPKKNKIETDKETGVTKQTVDGKHFVDIRSIEQLWGVKDKAYKQKNVEEYEQFLKDSTDYDLGNHAFQHGISRMFDRNEIIYKLVEKFKMHLYKISQPAETNIARIDNSSLNERIRRIWES